MAHTSCVLDKQEYMHTRPCTRPHARHHTHTRVRALTHTHKHITLLLHGITGPRTRLIVRYTHIAWLVLHRLCTQRQLHFSRAYSVQ